MGNFGSKSEPKDSSFMSLKHNDILKLEDSSTKTVTSAKFSEVCPPGMGVVGVGGGGEEN